MRNPSIYVGFVLTSENEDGTLRVSAQEGLSWHGMDDMQATMVQDILSNEFLEDFHPLLKDISTRFVDLGYAGAVLNETATVEQVEEWKGSNRGKDLKKKPATAAPKPKARR